MGNIKFLDHARNLRKEAERLRQRGLDPDAIRRERQAEVYEAIANLPIDDFCSTGERS
jgi:hypothetical protein